MGIRFAGFGGSSGKGSGCCGTTICATVCGLPAFGVTIQLLTAGVVVASCTTTSSGCCIFTQSGSYEVKITVGGTVCYNLTRTLSGGTITILLNTCGGAFVCCAGYAIPTTLTLTDAAGSLTFLYDPSYSSPLWTGGHSVTQLSCTVTTPNNICIVAPASQGPVRVCYQMICNASSSPHFTIQRSWSWVYQQGTLIPIWFQDNSGFAPGQFCITAPPAICGNPLTDTASCAVNPSSTSPFAISCTPTAAPSNQTSDPVGGPVSIS